MTPTSANDISKALEISRLELLDMGLRGNSLLHFRLGAKTLEVIDEVASEAFRVLVTEQKAMSFIPVPDALVVNREVVNRGAVNKEALNGEASDDEEVDLTRPLPEVFEEMYGDSRHKDAHLQTRLMADALDKRLLKINAEAESYSQEQGVDILYLALGFLTWYEDKNSDTPRKAPLVLIPVVLERGHAKERFRLRHTQIDLGPNLTLAAKLHMEFQIQLPEFEEELDLDIYIDGVADSIRSQPHWSVNKNEIALGFFSFGKFQMYQDLDSDNWPEHKKPSNHPVFQALLGGGFSSVQTEDQNPLRVLPLTELSFVKDADSSQTEAVMAVKCGDNLVIQGPPGTGKSQTITNIISESLADNKTILFVAEKMAALDVVKRRLDDCFLGDAVLELHSHKSNKRLVLEELKRTLELGRPVVKSPADDRRNHIALQAQLDSYCEQVNSPVLTSGTSYIDALGYYLALKDEAAEQPLPELDFAHFQHWDKTAFTTACARVRELVDHLDVMGVPAQHPFGLSSLEHFSPVEQEQVVAVLTKARAVLANCQAFAEELSKDLSLSAPETFADIVAIHRAGEIVQSAPDFQGLNLLADDWQQRAGSIDVLLTAGERLNELQEKNKTILIDQAWQADLLATRQIWMTVGRRWWRFLSGDFRKAKRTLQGLLRSELPKSTDDCIALIDDVLDYQTQLEKFTTYTSLGERLFGAQWQGRRSDWKVLKTLDDWLVGVHKEIEQHTVSSGLLVFLSGGGTLNHWDEKLADLSHAIYEFKALLNDVCQRLASQFPGLESGASEPESYPLAHVNTTLAQWHDQIDRIYPMVRYNALRNTLTANELGQVAELSYGWVLPPSLLLTTLKMTWYGGLVNEAYRSNDALRMFDRISQENQIQQFQRLDKALFHHAQEALVLKHYQGLPMSNAAGEMALIRKEMNKKRRHLPIRRLVAQAGRAIQQIKPVFMMSPMSVATYLEQGAVDFDLVIFDEASQVKVVDALVPILRGKQIVVVGDTRQMPPTDFFSKALELDDEEAEASETADIESILSMFLSQGATESMLRWHYRSRHDSLIAVSNQEFYESRLMIFPSPGVNPNAKGLSFNHIPESVYERGDSRTNPIEAQKVAAAVMNHAKQHAHLTLGVVAFSTAQRDCILLEVERLRREDDSAEAYFASNEHERFFVKNLENVQGDERDVIYISIGYGRSQSGKVTRSFGPINREGGERRLNVLITRARLSMEVFCNFTADDMATADSSPFGVRALESFLRYAQTGALNRSEGAALKVDYPFEEQVIAAIRQLGHDAVAQIGSAGFYIDIAVKDPNKPNRYILAVECDGASYHQASSVRERDRLRESVLQGLGWRFHRVWSTDWFRSPQTETERIQAAIEEALQFYRELDDNDGFAPDETGQIQLSSSESPAKPLEITRSPTSERHVLMSEAYQLANGSLGIPKQADISQLSTERVAKALRKVVDIEGAIHIKEAADRLADSAGFGRVGSRMMSHIEASAIAGQRQGLLFFESEYLYADATKTVTIRDRSELSASDKNLERVPPQEIRAALLRSVETAFSLSTDDAISEALSLMGFQRATAKAKEIVEVELQQLLQAGLIKTEVESSKLVMG